MYITDILPTLVSAANIKINHESLDGVNQWKTITDNESTSRKEILYNIESVFGFSAIMNDGWKLVNGSENLKNADWFGSSGENANLTVKSYINSVLSSETASNLPKLTENLIKVLHEKSITKCDKFSSATKCNPIESPCLFNIIDDPCEKNNLADIFPERVQFLSSRLSHHASEMVPSRRKPSDPNCDPKLHSLQWTWWLGDDENKNHHFSLLYMACVIFIATIMLIVFYKKIMTKQRNNLRMINSLIKN